jgi:cardiolipin synthase
MPLNYPQLLQKTQKSILHAKTLMVDSWFLVGSSNLDYRSLRKDLEINVVPQEDKTKKTLEAQFERDVAASKEVLLTDVNQRSRWIRFWGWFFYRFRFWF